MKTRALLSIGCVVMLVASAGWAQDAAPAASEKMPPEVAAQAKALVDGGIAYLLSQQDDQGGWTMNGAFEPALTALVLKCLIQQPEYTIESEPVRKGLARLVSFQKENGSIVAAGEGYENYQTSIAVCALAATNDPQYKDVLDKAVLFLRGIQITPGSKSPDGRDVTEDHPYLGGVSYGSHGRPDMNNMGWWMEAMHQAGVPSDDPQMQAALAFVTRSQNQSETNSMAWAQDGTDDGGFIYAAAQRNVTVPETMAANGKTPQSYGSISYVGWKSLLYAGLDDSDPRVKGVAGWVRRHWTWETNPNMPGPRGQEGLYFYYLALARTLNAWGIDSVTEAGTDSAHNWRVELVENLAKRVNEDGSWVNANARRWSEGSPMLTTTYVVQALQEALGQQSSPVVHAPATE